MHSRLWTVALVAGCVAPGPSDVDQPSETSETDVTDTPTDTSGHTDHVEPTSRPLCDLNELVPQPSAVEQAWELQLRNSEIGFFFAEPVLTSLEALGQGGKLGATPALRVQSRITRGWHRLRLGLVDEAIDDLTRARDEAILGAPWLRGNARSLLAMAWIRRAELDNCIGSGTGDACLVPFSEAALHQQTEGMTEASANLLALLQEDDGERLSQRWLYNVANMALGNWPDDVDPEFLIPPELLRSEAEIPPFLNVAPHLFERGVGLRAATLAGGAAVDDFDGDGLIDLLTSSMDPGQGMQLLLNVGNGTYCDASNASGVSAIHGLLSFSTADYDNDGDLDIAGPRGAWLWEEGFTPASLLRNDGTGRFTDVAAEAGVGEALGPTQLAVWGDVDGDGWLDLFVGRENFAPTENDPIELTARSSLYINQRNGRFVDQGAAYGVAALGAVKGASFGDFDNDGDIDLYVSQIDASNRLFENGGAPPFTDVTDAHGVGAPFFGFGTFFFDADQDGHLDLFAAAYPSSQADTAWTSANYGNSPREFVEGLLNVGVHATSRYYHNEGASLTDHTESVGLDDPHLVMGLNTGDLDADGWPDLYLGTGAPDFDALEPNTAYVNRDGGSSFLDVTTSAHLGHLQKGHGIAFADVDEDGDEDILAQIGGATPVDGFPNALFVNPSDPAASITLRLEGVRANRSAIGARVRVVTEERTFHHLVGPGGSFGNNSLQVEAAVGSAALITRIEIDWPGQDTEVLGSFLPQQILWIREGEGVVESRPYVRQPLAEQHEGHNVP